MNAEEVFWWIMIWGLVMVVVTTVTYLVQFLVWNREPSGRQLIIGIVALFALLVGVTGNGIEIDNKEYYREIEECVVELTNTEMNARMAQEWCEDAAND